MNEGDVGSVSTEGMMGMMIPKLTASTTSVKKRIGRTVFECIVFAVYPVSLSD